MCVISQQLRTLSNREKHTLWLVERVPGCGATTAPFCTLREGHHTRWFCLPLHTFNVARSACSMLIPSPLKSFTLDLNSPEVSLARGFRGAERQGDEETRVNPLGVYDTKNWFGLGLSTSHLTTGGICNCLLAGRSIVGVTTNQPINPSIDQSNPWRLEHAGFAVHEGSRPLIDSAVPTAAWTS